MKQNNIIEKLIISVTLTLIISGIIMGIAFFTRMQNDLRFEKSELTSVDFEDGLAPEIKILGRDNDFFVSDAVFSVFGIEQLKINNFKGEIKTFPLADASGYYYELVYPLGYYGDHEITLEVEDNSSNNLNESIPVRRISLYDQTISLSYIEARKDSEIIYNVETNTILQPGQRLYAGYRPSNLVNLLDTKIPVVGEMYLDKEAAEQLEKMRIDLKKDNIDFIVTSAYRSFQAQTYTYNYISSVEGRQAAIEKAAIPGYSEHQLGLAVDLVNSETNYVLPAPGVTTRLYSWLQRNAHKYGYQQTYDGTDDHISEEIWHWRYIGSTK